ncbi:MAG: tyrosine recombinase XerC [Burkholderiaceae bacterium]|nr:tyrosine recombinase XerC [Burkholderiaceae bacterium]
MNTVPTFSDDEAVETYLGCLQSQRQFSPHTLASYRRDLAQLRQLSEGARFSALTPSHIRRMVSKLHAGGMNPRSIARKLSAWRGFYKWFAEQGTLAINPVDHIRPPRRKRTLPDALPVDSAIQLVSAQQEVSDAAPDDQLTALCNRAMFELLYSSGLRVSELTGLDRRYVSENGYTSSGWINLDEQEVTVTGKGNKKRAVPVGQAATDAIRAWLDARDTLMDSRAGDGHALFVNLHGRRMTPRLVQLRLKARARALRLPQHVHPHMLRHSFASHVLQSSGDLRAVQEMLGHTSIASTQVYTALDFQHLAKIYDAAHPRAKKR